MAKLNIDENLVVEDYKNGLSSIKIAEKYSVSKQSVLRILHKNNIGMKSKGDYKPYNQYPFNEHWLDVLDCQEKFYFLGFFFADGNIRKDENTMKIKLQVQDKYILEKFNELFESNRPLYFGDYYNETYNQTQESYEMRLGSKHLKNRFEELGVFPNKTYSIDFPDYVLNEYLHHFIRGYFDGDGNVAVFGKNKKGEPRANITIVGNPVFIEKMKDILEEKLNIYINFYDKKTYALLKIERQKDVKKFLDWIYKDSKIHLIRKYEDYIKFINSRDFDKIDCKEMNRILEENADYIINKYKLIGNMSEIGREFGTNPTTITRFLERHNVEIVNRRPRKNK